MNCVEYLIQTLSVNKHISIYICFLDSKTLKESERDSLLEVIDANCSWIGYACHVNSPRDISRNMLKK